MAENRVFVSSPVFDRWVTGGAAELDGWQLRARATGARYAIEEAVHVLAEVSGAGDATGLVGRVRAVSELGQAGAEILDGSMVLGDLAYDVVSGFLVTPIGRTGGRAPAGIVLSALSALSATPGASDAETERAGASHSDEELLARYLIEKLE